MQTADSLRDIALQKVENAQEPTWCQLYYALAEQFINSRAAGESFIGEAIRLFAQERGLPNPTHPNAWGAVSRNVLNQWIEQRRIEQDGVAKSQSIRSHSCWCPVYVVRGVSAAQFKAFAAKHNAQLGRAASEA